MKIKDVRSIPLAGTKVDSGWETRLDKEENLHTLIEVKTDEGVSGIGSVYTSRALVLSAGRSALWWWSRWMVIVSCGVGRTVLGSRSFARFAGFPLPRQFGPLTPGPDRVERAAGGGRV